MGKRFEVIQLDDVYPLADEYGNEFAQRDYSLKVNQEYVAELAESMRKTGEPDEPITVIPEGGIYYVRTGRSRYEAMKLLGTRECHAVIDDDTSRKAAIEAIVHTDTKKKYEPSEKSRMVQQLQMFGDDQYVSEEAGITVEQSRRIRKSAKAAGDAAEDMTLDRLIAMADFADDPEAVAALTNCNAREFPAVLERLEKERARAVRASAVVSALEDRGIGVVGDVTGMRAVAVVSKPAEIPEELPDGCVASEHTVAGFYAIYQPAEDEAVDDAEEQAAATREALVKQFDEGRLRRGEWIADLVDNWFFSSPKALIAFVESQERRFKFPDVRGFVEAHGITVPAGPSEVITAYIAHDSSVYGIWNSAGELARQNCENYTKLLDAMMADGYEASDEEIGTYNQAADYLGR